MELLRRAWGFSPSNQRIFSPYQDDEIYPLHMLDQPRGMGGFMVLSMLFNDQLDANALRDSLSQLIGMGDWRKMGGRIKTSEKTNYFEIHCPKEFTAERPPLNFTTDKTYMDTSITQHTTGKHFPRSVNIRNAQIMQGDEEEILHLSTREGFPASARDIVDKDVPLLSLHVVLFSDATLVGVSWSHLQADGSGISALLHSWSLLMDGKVAEVPRVADARIDKLVQLDEIMAQEEAKGVCSRVAEEDIVVERERQGWFGITRYIARLLWQNMTQPAWERKFIYLPKRVKDRLVQKIKEDAATVEASKHTPETTPVSTGDALTAWFTRMLTSSSDDVSVVQYVNTRYRFPQLGPFIRSWSAASSVYLQNMVVPAHIRLPASSNSTKSTGALAREMKRQTLEQIEPNQLIALIRKLRKEIYPGVQLITLYGPLADKRILVNNVIVMNLIQNVAFNPAVINIGDRDEKRTNPPGSMVGYTLYRFVKPAPSGMHSVLMVGEDHAGGHYFYISTSPESWVRVKEELERLQAEVDNQEST